MRLVARGFEQTVSSDTDFFAGPPKLTTLRGILTIAAIHGNPDAFGDCYHCQANQKECTRSQCLKHSWTLPKFGSASKLFRDSISLIPGVFTAQKINDMNYNQLISDPSTYVKKRGQRSDDSILLRHMDDVVGTGPEEHLMSDFEHMKTSLYLTDVVVLRNERDSQLFGA